MESVIHPLTPEKEAELAAFTSVRNGVVLNHCAAIGGIGDITSDAKGSGARFNTGKVPYELLPLGVALRNWSEEPDRIAEHVIHLLGEWQAGNDGALADALGYSCYNDSNAGSLEDFADAARVFDYGRRKYAEWNWAKGMQWSVPLGCAIRHCLAILSGEENDPESGLPHIGHVKCNLLMLLTFAETYPEGDDRPVKWLKHSKP